MRWLVAITIGVALLDATGWMPYLAALAGPFGGLALFSHVDRAGALMNPRRQMLLRIVQQSPGLSFPALRKAAGMSRSNLTYHLLVLERNDLVVGRKVGRCYHYFSAGPQSGLERVALLRNERRLAIASYILRNPSCIQRDICEQLGLPQSRVNAHVQALYETGLVERSSQGRAVVLQATQSLGGALQQVGLVHDAE